MSGEYRQMQFGKVGHGFYGIYHINCVAGGDKTLICGYSQSADGGVAATKVIEIR